MEVKISYTNFLLQLLNKEENININEYQEELIVNLYLTLLSLSNLEFTEDIDKKEKDIIDDFLRKLNNLKVKIQLKRKPEEINKLAEELITQYYENVNILSIYIKDGVELENVINTLDARSLTKLIDKVTKDKMNKEDRKEERNKRRSELSKLLPTSNYYLKDDKIFIKNNDNYEEITIKYFLEMFSYLLNNDNYQITYNNKFNKKSRDAIIANIIKLLIVKDKKQEDIDKVLIPILLTYILSLNLNNDLDLDTSEFNIENIKISELYALANKVTGNKNKITKCGKISIPTDYLIENLKEMIKKGMYYYKEDTFILENKDNDFRVSINLEKIQEFLKSILETKLVSA